MASPPSLSGLVTAAAGGRHVLALRNNGTIVAFGHNDFGQSTVPPDLASGGVIDVAGGDFFSVALKSNGEVVAWGRNASQECEVANEAKFGIIRISAKGYHTLALKSDGRVIAFGNNINEQTVVPTGLNDATAVSAGAFHSLALRRNGTVVGWGLNTSGQATPPAGLNNVKSIAAGNRFSLALKNNGEVVGWGAIIMPEGLTSIQAIAAGNLHAMALKEDGTVIAWGDIPAPPANLRDVYHIAASADYSLALRTIVPPTIVTPPTSQIVPIGGTAEFTVVATGTPPPAFQWFFNDDLLLGETSATLRLVGVRPEQAGSYKVRAQSEAGLAISTPATLTVGVPARITAQPVGLIAPVGAHVNLSVGATGTAPLTYEWRKDGQLLNNNASGLSLGTASESINGVYTVTVRNAYGSETSLPATVTVMALPGIAQNPASHTIQTGGSAILRVSASGSGPFTYEWKLNGQVVQTITGPDGAEYRVADAQSAQAGRYTVTVRNAVGSATSAEAVLTLLDLDVYAGLTITGAAGVRYRVEFTNDVAQQTGWTELATFDLPFSPYLYIDQGSPGHGKRFYRSIKLD